MDDRGLACPVNFPTVSRSRRISPPAPSTTGPLTSKAYISQRAAHLQSEVLSPLSTGPPAKERAGLIPNNRKLPLVLYRQALAPEDLGGAPEHALESLFKSNGWHGVWVDGIYDFHHYHSTAHEVLGIAKGEAKVRFGGPQGPVIALGAGDAVVIPAGVGHCLIDGDDLVVVGAYPEGQDWDLCRATEADRAKALENIPWVPLPRFDPVMGASGPVLELWID